MGSLFRTALILIFCLAALATDARDAQGKLVFGIQGTAADYHDWDRFMTERLQGLFQPRGITGITFVGEEDYQTFIRRGQQGEFDIVKCGPMAYLEIARKFPLTPVLKTAYTVEEGKPTEYRAVLVTTKGEYRNGLPRGVKVGLVSPSSTSGGLFPQLMLRDLGGSESEVVLSWWKSHLGALEAMLAGIVDVAGVGDFVLTRSYLEQRVNKDEVRLPQHFVLARSEPIPSDPIAVSAALAADKALVEDLSRAFRVYRNTTGQNRYSWLEPAGPEHYLGVAEAMEILEGRNRWGRTLRKLGRTLGERFEDPLVQLVVIPLALAVVLLLVGLGFVARWHWRPRG
ncbi:MAG: hypothetical protein A2284_13380 [Deltaproteobacteria bacterium RIFOXYA12_FULL_61_11]|nr:MAG: hypothetical protein A2284_13380 [Deltaproteobacteria bacterium RIFOXYA12_FULL_61_11]